jgi:hypothetical protein
MSDVCLSPIFFVSTADIDESRRISIQTIIEYFQSSLSFVLILVFYFFSSVVLFFILSASTVYLVSDKHVESLTIKSTNVECLA